MDSDCCRREKFKYALYTKFKEPKLYRYASQGQWDLIPQRCKSHPKEALFVHAYGSRDTVLHRILRASTGLFDEDNQVEDETKRTVDQLKLDAVSALLAANRQATSTPDAFRLTPLHLACMDLANCGQAAAHMLIDSNPNACSLQDAEKRTPLHYLVARNDCIPLGLLSKVISHCPQALDMRDVADETPLDIATARQDEIQDYSGVVEILKADYKRETRLFASGSFHVSRAKEPKESTRRAVSAG